MCLIAKLFIGVFGSLLAQDQVSAELARQAIADVAALASQPTLGSWRRNEILEPAHYENGHEQYEVDFRRANRSCAASVATTGSVTRAALFYLPVVERGALPALPEQVDPNRIHQCRMQGLWIQAPPTTSIDAVIHDLSAAWGVPNGASSEPDIRGWKLWANVVCWHRGGIDIWVARDPRPPAAGASRLIVYARRNIPRDPDHYFGLLSPALRSEAIDQAARIAGGDPALADAMLRRTRCDLRQPPPEPESTVAQRLAAWLKASSNLPAPQHAAALLVADAYLACGGAPSRSLAPLGAKFGTICPQDGPTYLHNFLEQAVQLDPRGPAGELAAILRLANPCLLRRLLRGRGDWPDLAIARGKEFLRDFPTSAWTPWVGYAIARAHTIKLAGPVGDDPGQSYPLTAAAAKRERAEAIDSFKRFIKQKPEEPESVLAWQEAWRLLAGLPPTLVHFGCCCE